MLNLVLGPLDLNLLGLEVHLDKVVLDIIAVTGAGNLLGNLLCAVAGLLDGTGVLRPDRRPAEPDPGGAQAPDPAQLNHAPTGAGPSRVRHPSCVPAPARVPLGLAA